MLFTHWPSIVVGFLLFSTCLSSFTVRADDLPKPCGDRHIGYDLTSKGVTFSAQSPTWSGRTYFLQPCTSVDSNLCPESSNQQQCFTASNSSAASGLGSASNSNWQPLNFDWANGAVSLNTDSAQPMDVISRPANLTMPPPKCAPSARGSDNGTLDASICDTMMSFSIDGSSAQTCWAVSVVYLCRGGTNTVSVVREPQSNKDMCLWVFEVDAEVVCAAFNQSQSNTKPGHTQDLGLSPVIWLTLLLPVISIVAVVVLVSLCWRKNVRRNEIQQEVAEQAAQLRALQREALHEPLYHQHLYPSASH